MNNHITRRHSLQWMGAACAAPSALLSACGGGTDQTESPTQSAQTTQEPRQETAQGAAPDNLNQADATGVFRSYRTYKHGDLVTIYGAFGSVDVTQTFLGGASGMIEAQADGDAMANGNGWYFNELGYPTRVAIDPKRGKVLFTSEDSSHYNATRHFDPGFAIPEQRYFYKAHWVRAVLLLDGQPYDKSYQWKHERVNWQNTIVDGNGEIKVHEFTNGGGGVMTYVNRSAQDKSVYWGGQLVGANQDWALMEMMAYTGTQGVTDGKLVTRVHLGGKTYVNQNRQTERIYADPSLRLRHFIEQNYFGNFGQVEYGVNNPSPRPQVRELWSDDSRVIVGNNANSGWQRVELRDAIDLRYATVRELQTWQTWNGNITLNLNTGGLPSGLHKLYLVVIDGVDANGWDVVKHSVTVMVQVP